MLNANRTILKKINVPFYVNFSLVNTASFLILFKHTYILLIKCNDYYLLEVVIEYCTLYEVWQKIKKEIRIKKKNKIEKKIYITMYAMKKFI